jgi:hypothetical protein
MPGKRPAAPASVARPSGYREPVSDTPPSRPRKAPRKPSEKLIRDAVR